MRIQKLITMCASMRIHTTIRTTPSNDYAHLNEEKQLYESTLAPQKRLHAIQKIPTSIIAVARTFKSKQ